MTISAYSDLSTDIQDRLHRSDLSTKISNNIQLLEDELNRKLRCRQMITSTNLSVSTATTTLPTDYLEGRNVQLLSGSQPPLLYVTPEQMDVYDRGLYTGQPRLFTIRGSLMQVAPSPDQTYSVFFEYYQKIPGLEANSTNWLLTAYPMIYVAGAIVFLQEYVTDMNMASWYKNRYDEVILDINRADDNATYGGSVMRVRPDVSR